MYHDIAMGMYVAVKAETWSLSVYIKVTLYEILPGKSFNRQTNLDNDFYLDSMD